jgi:hypothetical protein
MTRLLTAALAAIALVGTYAMRGEEELVRNDPTLAAADG